MNRPSLERLVQNYHLLKMKLLLWLLFLVFFKPLNYAVCDQGNTSSPRPNRESLNVTETASVSDVASSKYSLHPPPAHPASEHQLLSQGYDKHFRHTPTSVTLSQLFSFLIFYFSVTEPQSSAPECHVLSRPKLCSLTGAWEK